MTARGRYTLRRASPTRRGAPVGEKETASSLASERVAGPTDTGPAGLAIGDQGTTENPHGSSGGGGGGGGGHGHLFPQGGEMPTSPGTGTSADPAPEPSETAIIKSKSNITNN